MKPKQDARWPDAHIRLKKLYEQRVPSGMTQEEFGQEYGIGTQGMVWQYLNGHTPLNYDAASKFAEGLRCTIEDISPQMQENLQRRILPAMGLKSWRRAAALALVCLSVPLFSPSPADASQNFALAMAALVIMSSAICRDSLTFLSFIFNDMRRKSYFRNFRDVVITLQT